MPKTPIKAACKRHDAGNAGKAVKVKRRLVHRRSLDDPPAGVRGTRFDPDDLFSLARYFPIDLKRPAEEKVNPYTNKKYIPGVKFAWQGPKSYAFDGTSALPASPITDNVFEFYQTLCRALRVPSQPKSKLGALLTCYIGPEASGITKTHGLSPHLDDEPINDRSHHVILATATRSGLSRNLTLYAPDSLTHLEMPSGSACSADLCNIKHGVSFQKKHLGAIFITLTFRVLKA